MKRNIEEIVVHVDEETKRKNEEGLAKWFKKTSQNKVEKVSVRHQKDKGEYLYRTSQWNAIRARLLAKNPVCPFCSEPSTDCHHVIPFGIQDEDIMKQVFSAEFNILPVCEKHHHDIHNNKLNPLGKQWYDQYKMWVNNEFIKRGIITKWV